jgi:hypothetical protein
MLTNPKTSEHDQMNIEETHTQQTLRNENIVYLQTGGRSQENCFTPAFLDSDTDEVFLSRFANGKLAPLHIFDGLPSYCIVQRDADGHVSAVRASIISGFVKAGHFYTRDEAAALA